MSTRPILFFLFVCVFVRLRISPSRIKLAASNIARWFVGVLGRESPISGNFAPPGAQNRTNRTGHREVLLMMYILTYRKRHATDAPFVAYRAACGRRSACVDIGQSPTDVLAFCACTVTDCSAEDKASGVTFCLAVHRRPRQGITQSFVNFAPPEAQKRTKRPARGSRPPQCKHYRTHAPT